MSEWEEVKSDGGIWLPTAIGDLIEGTILWKKEGKYGMQLRIEQANGVQLTTPSHKVLQAKLGDLVVGDVVKIVFQGEELPTIKGHNKTKIYGVYKKETKVEEVK